MDEIAYFSRELYIAVFVLLLMSTKWAQNGQNFSKARKEEIVCTKKIIDPTKTKETKEEKNKQKQNYFQNSSNNYRIKIKTQKKRQFKVNKVQRGCRIGLDSKSLPLFEKREVIQVTAKYYGLKPSNNKE